MNRARPPLDPAVVAAREKVRREWTALMPSMDELLAKHAGKYVLFEGGVIVGIYEQKDAAMDTGRERFGKLGGFVVTRIEDKRPLPITASAMFSPR